MLGVTMAALPVRIRAPSRKRGTDGVVWVVFVIMSRRVVVGLGLVLLLLLSATACTQPSPTDQSRISTPSPASTTMTWGEWVVFSDNGIVERRVRFEEFSPPPTPVSKVRDFLAYLDRELVRTEAIEPEGCWAEMHGAYLAIVRNDREMMRLLLDGEMAAAERLLSSTGELNHTFTDRQQAAATACAEPAADTAQQLPPPTRVDTPPKGAIGADEAALHVGKKRTVCGRVVTASYASSSRGRPTFLNLDVAYPNQIFTIVIWREWRGSYPSAPEKLFSGQFVCAKGMIASHNDVPQIEAGKRKVWRPAAG